MSKVLRGAGEKCRVEEVFPGLRDGSSAGLVSVTLPDEPDKKVRRAALKALRDDEAISYSILRKHGVPLKRHAPGR